MPNEGGPKFTRPEDKESLPATLDIIFIDGRWGQVRGSGSPDLTELVIWLDGKEPKAEHINFNKYILTETINKPIFMIRDQFTSEEISKVHWDSENDPNMKLQVNVFGRFTKKDKPSLT